MTLSAPRQAIQALLKECGFEPINHKSTPGQLRMLGRVQASNVALWNTVRPVLLKTEQGHSISVDVSRQHFIGADGRERYGWRLIFQHATLDTVLDSFVGALRQAIVSVQSEHEAPTELTSIALHGAPGRLKGLAGPIGKISVGKSTPLENRRAL